MNSRLLDLAARLRQNTKNRYLQDYLGIFVNSLQQDMVYDWTLYFFLKQAAERQLDLSGWELADLNGSSVTFLRDGRSAICASSPVQSSKTT